MKKLLLPICLCLSLLSLAQNRISGKILDSKTGEPLAFAHVGILHTTIGTVTNESGQYSLIIPVDLLTNKLAASYLGYDLYTREIASINFASPLVISLMPSSIALPEITVTVKNRNILEEAVELIPKNHDQGDMRLRGFWRAQMKNSERHIQLVETAFDIFRKDQENAMKILRGRTIKDSSSFDQFPRFNAGISPKSVFSGSFLTTATIASRKFQKTHTSELTDVTSYQGRPVYVVSFQKKKRTKNGLEGTILLDTETLAFVKYTYQISSKDQSPEELYPSWILKKLSQLGNSVWTRRNYECNYQYVEGQWYFRDAHFDVAWELSDNDESFRAPVTYKADLVVTEIDKSDFVLPEKDERAGKQILSQQNTTSSKDFWKGYNYLMPDLDFEKIIEEIEARNKARREELNGQ